MNSVSRSSGGRDSSRQVGPGLGLPSPAVVDVFEPGRPLLAGDRDCRLVGGLVLVQREAAEDASVAGQDVDGVFDRDPRQSEMRGVSDEARHRADEPLDGVDHVR